jgi:hypothetical protein
MPSPAASATYWPSSGAACPTPRSLPTSPSAFATVKTYVTRLLAKLDARDRVQLVIIAYDTGLVTLAQ